MRNNTSWEESQLSEPKPSSKPRRRGTLCLQFMFSTQSRVNTGMKERKKKVVCVCICVSDNTHACKTTAGEQTHHGQMSQNSSECSDSPDQRSKCLLVTADLSQGEAATRRWHKDGHASSDTTYSTNLLLLLLAEMSSLPDPSAFTTKDISEEILQEILFLSSSRCLSLSLSPCWPPTTLLNYIQIRLLMKSVGF